MATAGRAREDSPPPEDHVADVQDARDGAEPMTTAQVCDGSDRMTTVGMILESAVGLRRALEPSLACLCGPGAPWFEVLIRLSRSPGNRLRMADLAEQTMLTPSGLTRAIDRLSELGLVERQACPADRRGSFAALTDAGREMMESAVPRHIAMLDELFEGVFAPGEEHALAQTLRKLRDHVNPGAAHVPAPPAEPLASPVDSN
jgi:MarR family 2-MHQ and catechol resistance regulon transcriptional repressor